MNSGFNEDLKRIETKVDKLTDAVTRLILVEERQTSQGVRIGTLEQAVVSINNDLVAVDKKLDRWVNMGFGAWAVIAALFMLFEFVVKVQQ